MKQVVWAAMIVGALAAVPRVSAQTPVASAASTAQIQARQQISAFEAALETSVRVGSQMFERRLQESSAANMVMVAGLTRARGFRLDNYGVVFDVEFPSMRRSMVWTMQELERAMSGKARQVNDTTSTIQPREIYQTEITNALVNAILDYTSPVGVAADEWLTVAARESVVDRRVMPGDPRDPAITVILRIKGSDLNALRDRQLAPEEARKRVEIKQY